MSLSSEKGRCAAVAPPTDFRYIDCVLIGHQGACRQCRSEVEEAVVDTADKANILLVDDEPRNLFALGVLLEDLDQNLLLAHSGEEALRCALEQDLALILLDVRMPG